MPYLAEFEVLLGVMLCPCVSLSVSNTWCGSHRMQACGALDSCCLCGEGCVEFML